MRENADTTGVEDLREGGDHNKSTGLRGCVIFLRISFRYQRWCKYFRWVGCRSGKYITFDNTAIVKHLPVIAESLINLVCPNAIML